MAKVIQNILLVTVQYLLIFTSPNFFFAGQVNSFRFQKILYGRIKLQKETENSLNVGVLFCDSLTFNAVTRD